MSAWIFLGGMVSGFLLGFITVALLVFDRVQTREEEIYETRTDHEESCSCITSLNTLRN